MRYQEFREKVDAFRTKERQKDPATGLWVVRAIGHAHAGIEVREIVNGGHNINSPYLAVLSTDQPRGKRRFGLIAGTSYGDEEGVQQAVCINAAVETEVPDWQQTGRLYTPEVEFLVTVDHTERPVPFQYIDGDPASLVFAGEPTFSEATCVMRDKQHLGALAFRDSE